MSDMLFEQVKVLSLEVRSLIRQGVKEGVETRIIRRNELLQEWFTNIKELIQMTNEQQNFLEELLSEEQKLLDELHQEQQMLAGQQRGQRNANQYLQH